MRNTSRIISTYAADTSGVCSALYELGGMTVIHDAGGCNSTYATHDEPRWYDRDGMVFVSMLTEAEAVMGDDEKFISDVVATANELHPRFIALDGTPIPSVTGFDFAAAARVIEKRTGIPSLGFRTDGMHPYTHGVSAALESYVRRFADISAMKKPKTVNILGATPLDLALNGSAASIRRFLTESGYGVAMCLAMDCSPDDAKRLGEASVNLVVSDSGVAAANALRELFGTPFVAGVPVGTSFPKRLASALEAAERTGECAFPCAERESGGNAVFIGEGIYQCSLACETSASLGVAARVICPIGASGGILAPSDSVAFMETDLECELADARLIVADPMYRPIAPDGAIFVPLPHTAFSGRLYARSTPNLIGRSIENLFPKELLK